VQKPYLIDFSRLGASNIGFISVAENQKNLPFDVARIFWTYFTPEDIIRGRHAHHKTEQILVAVAGRINVTVELPDDSIDIFRLETPNIGLYLPPNVWHTMQYSHSAVQLVLASQLYDENDYIRNYDEFKEVWGK
jgi:dTDP-4-dehydrorhamnose 3,5-epimerase-like enzyme